MYKIYLFDRYDDIDEVFWTRMKALMPKSRQIKADSYKFERDRENTVISYMLLCYAMRIDQGRKGLPGWKIGKNGKPYLEEKDLFFSVSHCKQACVLALGNREIGVDVQEISDADTDVMKFAFSPEERKRVEEADDRDEEFTRIWTFKESYLKMTGDGLGVELSHIDTLGFEDEFHTCRHKDCIISVIEKQE